LRVTGAIRYIFYKQGIDNIIGIAPNDVLALLRNMDEAPRVAIDEGTKQDLRWFIACAHVVNGSVKLFKCRQLRYHIYVDASLKGVGGQ
jgi:Mg2+/Co2+ transporter CorB